MSEVCSGCGHTLSKHYEAVDGSVYCLVSWSGVSDRGIIGVPWTRECDCKNYVSAQVESKKKEEDKRKKEMEDLINAITKDS